MNTYPRLVSWSYYSGAGLLSSANDKESVRKIFITDPAGEKLLKRGQVAILNSVGLFETPRDPYFRLVRETGFTSRARRHGDMKRKMVEEYPELENKLTGFKAMVKEYGEFVYLDLAFIDNYVNSLVKGNPDFYSKNFYNKNSFNKDFILKLIDYNPRDLMHNSVINDYEKKHLPSFMAEIKIKFPLLYEEVLAESNWLQENEDRLSLVGKKARLHSLLDGAVKVDENGRLIVYNWDGVKLTNEKRIKNNLTIYQKIIPPYDMIVEICNDEVVGPDIELVD